MHKKITAMQLNVETKGSTSVERLSAGKYRRMTRLCDAEGRFAMLAIDQRGSLQKMIGARRGIAPDTVADDDLRRVKRAVTAAVAPLASAVLTDPLYGYTESLDVIPPNIGVLLSLEVTGYEATGEAERLSRLIEGWSVEAIQRVGADGVKLLLWHHPEASDATQRHQQDIVRSVGEACAGANMPFVLELVTYSMDGPKGPAFARGKPELVIHGARTYSDPSYGVDLLKLEFPGELKYTEEYQDRTFGKGEVVYDLETVRDACARLDEAAGTPWLILSAGVDPEEFVEDIRLANAAGASGFLCGRAVWKHVVDYVATESGMQTYMETTGRRFFERIRNANVAALPWHRHRRFRDLLVPEGVSV